ncbi:hypothetical protein Q8W35_17180 [Pseudoalteromonas sp. 1_MG-2023]|nr:hypothetical protein [Pseudoalteromonas sp. 1_MG-2023]MDP2636467.1 hypothetical protein [Pseudoalteromonas sp. 1_MG-2023]
MRVPVGVKSDLGKALIASNSGSIVKINNATNPLGVAQALTLIVVTS